MAITPFSLSDNFTMEEFNSRISETNNTITNTIAESVEEIYGIVNQGWTELWKQETAGSGTWIAPNLNDGKSYQIGVFLISGGESGGADNNGYGVRGGFSGLSESFLMEVTPGDSKLWVCGAGGVGPNAPYGSSSQKLPVAGGSTTFDGKLVYGAGVQTFGGLKIYGQKGLDSPTTYRDGVFGGFEIKNDLVFGLTICCFNPFTLEKILGTGGGASQNQAGVGGKSPITGLGGGDAHAPGATNSTGYPGNAPGCGGGAAVSQLQSGVYRSATGGNGADGAIYIYVRGVAV